uniref:Uncharacterized protein n=1 Tax=Manihot esculenta TaxID=3983 RepID=A0A2C9V3A1_MANES
MSNTSMIEDERPGTVERMNQQRDKHANVRPDQTEQECKWRGSIGVRDNWTIEQGRSKQRRWRDK